MRRLRSSEEDGTILFLTIGLAVVLLLLVAVVVDVSAVVLDKRALASAADGAAIAAAQQADRSRIDDGLGADLPLDAQSVSDVVQTYQDNENEDEPHPVTLTSHVEGDDNEIAVVTASRTVTLPFLGWLKAQGTFTLTATSRAQAPVTR